MTRERASRQEDARLRDLPPRLFVLLLALVCQASAVFADVTTAEFAQRLEEMQQAYDRIDHYTAIFLLQERVDRELRPALRLELKFKKPLKIYLRWLEGQHEGRQALYPAGVDGTELWVRQPLLLGAVTISLDPHSPRAKKGSRHAITDMGIGRLLDFIGDNASRGIQRGELTVESGGQRITFDRPTQRYILHFPAAPANGYYCKTAIVDVDREYWLPIYTEVFDWYGQLIERYGYLDLRLNPGLTDEDFDPKNPIYGF